MAPSAALLFDDALHDSSCASRRARLPWTVFAELLRRTLRPQGAAASASRRVLALVAIAGDGWSAVQSDQHAAGQAHQQESEKSARVRGVCGGGVEGVRAGGEAPVLRVSFVKLLELLRPLWLVLALGADALEEWQKAEVSQRFYEQARGCLTPPRRKRSCPRAVRQPVRQWPRLIKNESWTGPVIIQFR